MSNSIKVLVVGAMHMVGVSEKGKGSPYDFAEISYAVPAQPLNNANCNRSVAGLEVMTIGVPDKSLIFHLQSHTFPLELNLEISPDPRNVRSNVCTGYSLVTPLALEPANDDKKSDIAKKFGA
jgi:hypothetical protein